MRKLSFIASLILFQSLATANEASNQVDFYANEVQKQENKITANKNAVLFSNEYFIRADKASYDEENQIIELEGDVSVLRRENEKAKACFARLNLNTNEASFRDFFFANADFEVWFQSEASELNDKFFIGKNSIVSSCNVQSPDWQIKFSEGKLNRDKKFLHLYNARLYVKEVPILYLPYFGFSVDTSRQSGLLVPKLNFNRTDGFYYEQPIYFAPYENLDFEISPQIRVNRGVGAYSSLRFMDSKHSSGELSFGLFREREKYYREENLKNKTHRGVELKYTRDDLIKTLAGFEDNYQEGLYIDGIYLNDVDYLNLGRRDFRDITSLVESELNYFLADEDNFYAMYARYYIDTSAINNDNTLQEYPSFQYHRFLSGLLDNHLQYSFDANFHRYYRKKGIYANVLDYDLPLSYHTKLFDEYLNFTFTESLNGSFINYTRNPEANKEHLFRNYHRFNLYTDLARGYESFFHTINFGFEYLINGGKSGIITQDFLSINEEPESLSAKVVQYFYNENGDKKLKHRFNIYYDIDRSKMQSFVNMAEYFFNDDISLSNEAMYSYTQKRFTKSISTVNASVQKFDFDFIHAYRFDEDELGAKKRNFISTKANYELNTNYKLFSGAWFDTNRSKFNAWEVGYTYQRKCWNYSLMYKEQIDPQLSSSGIEAKSKNGIYLAFNFYPLGGVGYDFSLKENESSVSEF